MFFGKVARDSREPLAGNRRVSPEDAPSLTSERIAFVLVLLATAIVAIIRWGLLSMPLERDEGEYAYAGQLVLQGIPPYKLAYNMKLPGTYVVYAAIMAVFGQTPSAIHIGLLLSSLISMALVFFIARRMFDPLAAAASSAVYGFLALSPSVLGLAGHATQFMVPFVLGGVLLLQKWELAGTAKHLGWSALLFGMAFLMKQQAVFFVAFGLVFVLRTAVKEHRRVAAAVSLYSVSALIPFALTCACLGALGVFGRFWFWCFSYARQYVSQIALRDGIGLLHLNGASVVRPGMVLWTLALAGLIAAIISTRLRTSRWLLLSFAVSSFGAVCPGWYFRAHYFVLLIPAVSLLIGALIHSLTGSRSLFAVVQITAYTGCIVLVWSQSDLLLHSSPEDAVRAIYRTNPFVESVEIADYLRRNTSPGDTIAVFGSEPQIYFYSKRPSATGHIYMYGLMEPQPFALNMQKEMIREIETCNPRYIVFVHIQTSWLLRDSSHKDILNWMERYAGRRLVLDGMVDLVSLRKGNCYWGARANRVPQSPNYIYVFKQKN